MRDWTPMRNQWVCTCGHSVEDHNGEPVWPCLCCDCDAFEENLRAQFTSLEVLVQSLKSQGGFLSNALGSQA